MFNTIPTCNQYKTPQGDIWLYPQSLRNPVSSQTHSRPHCAQSRSGHSSYVSSITDVGTRCPFLMDCDCHSQLDIAMNSPLMKWKEEINSLLGNCIFSSLILHQNSSVGFYKPAFHLKSEERITNMKVYSFFLVF